MTHYICEFCGVGFERWKRANPPRFCSRRCYYDWARTNSSAAGQFEKGIRSSSSTEFMPGQQPSNHCDVGTVRIRSRRRGNKQRAWIKVAEPSVWRLQCHVVWEEQRGPIPDGKLIHHIDDDTLNDSLDNLALVSRSEHLKIHRPKFNEKRRRALKATRKRVNCAQSLQAEMEMQCVQISRII